MAATTPLTRDVLGRYSCNTWEEATNSPQDIDVVVIGAGMYGGYAAAKLYQISKERGVGLGGLRVLLLEAGPFLIPGHAQNLPSFGLNVPASRACAPRSTPQLVDEVWGIGWRSFENFVGQAYCVGGKGIYWGGWCPRLRDSDLAQWPEEVRHFLTQPQVFLPPRPITHKESVTDATFVKGELLSGYEALEYEIGIKPSDDFIFDPKEAQLDNPATVGLNKALFELAKSVGGAIDNLIDVQVAPIAVQTQSYISGLFALDKYSSVPAVISAARDDHTNAPPNRFALIPDAHVVRLECAPTADTPRGTRVVQRIVVRNAGEEKSLEIPAHCQVVLALGCIESTRLALESLSLAGSGLASRGERMGRNYMVHYREDFRFSVDRAKLEAWTKMELGKPLSTAFHQACLHVQYETKNGRFHLQLYAAPGKAGDPKLYVMIPDLDAQKQLSAMQAEGRVSIVLRGIAEQKGEAVLIQADPNRDLTTRDDGFGFIDLAGDDDFDGDLKHRRAWAQFPVGANSAPIWEEMFEGANQFCCELRKKIGDDPGDVTRDGHQGFGTTFHDSGTLWMGDDPDTSVCDANGHLHHVTNVYCVDQALFPTVGSANPVLTGLALARKAVEDIVSKHESQPPRAAPGFQVQDLATGWLSYPYAGMVLEQGVLKTRPNGGLGLYYLPQVRSDWEVLLDWRAMRGTEIPNSGVLFRLPDPHGFRFDDEATVASYFERAVEVQLDESGKNYRGSQSQPRAIYGDSRHKTGAIYGVAPARQWAAKTLAPEQSNGYWNELHVKLQANRAEVRLNGKLVCQTELPASKLNPGFFGLQFHTGQVQFKHIRIK